jgi:cell division protease FtsH
MSHAVGPVSVLPEPEFDFGFMTGDGRAPSESTRQLVDSEIRTIVDECHRHATEILRANRVLLDRLADELLARETLDEADAYAVVGLPVPPTVGR